MRYQKAKFEDLNKALEKLRFTAAFFLTVGIVSSLATHRGESAEWVGDDGLWSSSSNWNPQEVPSDDDVTVGGATSIARISEAVPDINSLLIEDSGAVYLESDGRIAVPVTLDAGLLRLTGGTLGRNQANSVSRNSIQVLADAEVSLEAGTMLTSGVNPVAGTVNISGGTWNHTSRFDLNGDFNMSGGNLVTASVIFRDVGAATFRVTGTWDSGNNIQLGAGGFQFTNSASVIESLFNESGGIEPITTAGDFDLRNTTLRVDMSEATDPGYDVDELIGNHVMLAAQGAILLDDVAFETGGELLARGLDIGGWDVFTGSGDWDGYEILEVSVIPEPVSSTLLLSAAAVGSILFLRRRRRME